MKRVEQGHPTIVDYFYHEEVRGKKTVEKETDKIVIVEIVICEGINNE